MLSSVYVREDRMLWRERIGVGRTQLQLDEVLYHPTIAQNRPLRATHRVKSSDNLFSDPSMSETNILRSHCFVHPSSDQARR